VSRCRDGLRKFLNPRARLGAESRVHMNPQAVLEPPPLQRSAPRAPPQRCTAARAPAALIRPRRRRAPGGGARASCAGVSFVCKCKLGADLLPARTERGTRRTGGELQHRGACAGREGAVSAPRESGSASSCASFASSCASFASSCASFAGRCASPGRCAPRPGRGRGRGLFQGPGRQSARSPAPACTRATPRARGRPRTQATRPAAADREQLYAPARAQR